jgi:hypothetical protein
MNLSALLLSLLILAPVTAEVSILEFPPRSKVSLSMGERNRVEVERAGTVARVSIRMEGLKPPYRAVEGMNSYVTWAVSPEGSFDNLGALVISGSKGTLQATTRFDRFGLIVTAEPHHMVDRPSSRILCKNDVPRGASAVSTTVGGFYEYLRLPENHDEAPPLVMEARAAMAIASAFFAFRRAEREYRQAKAAFDTMEELLTRNSSPEVLSGAANAAIRQAQQAVIVARQTFR